MQVLCKASNTASDVRCPVCGQGFLVYWTRPTREEQTQCRIAVSHTLRAQHATASGHAPQSAAGAHPSFGFHLSVVCHDAQPAAISLGTSAVWQTA